MAQQTINIGASPNDGTGTPLRTSFDYTNQNFTELYTALGGGVGLPGATTQVIFNDGGTNLAGDAGLVYNKTTDALTVGGNVQAASATITGDLTVDTSTLKVDSANNVVGITNASPLTGTDGGLTLGVIGSSKAMAISMFNCFARLRERDAVNNFAITTNIDTTNAVLDDNTRTSWKVRFGSGNDNFLIQRAAIGSTTFQDLYSVSTTSAVWSDGAGGTRMTLNATGLGVGVTPAAGDGSGVFKAAGTGSLTANSRVGLDVRELISGNQAGILLGAMTTENTAVIGARTASGNIAFQTYNGSAWGERMRIDYLGNVGIGVTPSAWGSSYKSVQVNEAGGFAGKNDGLIVAQNCYFNGTNWVNNRASTFSSRYDMNVAGNGIHAWYVYNASFGTVGNTIPFTQAMTLDASGNLLVGRTTMAGSERLHIEGSVTSFVSRFSNTSATTPSGLFVRYSSAAPNGTGDFFVRCDDNVATRFELRSNGGLANYSANNVNLSDARTKTDIKPLISYWNKIKALELVTFKYKDQTHDDDNIGLISQQVESVAPEFVSNDGFGQTPADGVPLKGIYTTDLYHGAIKALQEAMTRIEVLEAKLA